MSNRCPKCGRFIGKNGCIVCDKKFPSLLKEPIYFLSFLGLDLGFILRKRLYIREGICEDSDVICVEKLYKFCNTECPFFDWSKNENSKYLTITTCWGILHKVRIKRPKY